MLFQPVINKAIGAGITDTSTIIDVRGQKSVSVFWMLLGTTTTADMTLQDLLFVDPVTGTISGTTGAIVPPNANLTAAPSSDGVNVCACRTYLMNGLEKVAIRIKNNNAGALAYTVTVAGETHP